MFKEWFGSCDFFWNEELSLFSLRYFAMPSNVLRVIFACISDWFHREHFLDLRLGVDLVSWQNININRFHSNNPTFKIISLSWLVAHQ